MSVPRIKHGFVELVVILFTLNIAIIIVLSFFIRLNVLFFPDTEPPIINILY